EDKNINIYKTMEYKAIGLMSGTSLDGLDIALCGFSCRDDKWEHVIYKAVTVQYPHPLRQKLENAMTLSGFELTALDVELGEFFALSVNEFLRDVPERPEIISSHGHTVFHIPAQGITKQIGSGAVIAAKTRIDTICDFRTVDVALGGQGAPLVPIGDELLFPQYGICLNLGGFSNLSFRSGKRRIAYDIAPNNMAINYLTNQIGVEYDKDGNIARENKTDENLLSKLNALDYYKLEPPKSLGKEWFEQVFKPILDESVLPVGVKIATVTSHIVRQLANDLNKIEADNVLVTGGGAKNKFLIDSLQNLTDKKIVIPDTLTVDYKEALIFAFLGVLRRAGVPNCLKSVTGAACDSIGGAWYQAQRFSD
ncbi:MAG: anhydro-N-acetylmuramic acid kinase, partial [Bacteroidales bacterium]|nr:anhydro-N-acetylmuramic acid kinase [Bacteroidales bacterium]